MCAHMPKEALAKNFGVGKGAFDRIPKAEKFIFKADLPPPLENVVVRKQPVVRAVRRRRCGVRWPR
jgi:hypothetical protein